MKIDSLLQGAVDMHVHGYPEISLDYYARVDDFKAVEMARDYGLKGFVLKSQMWPTVDRAHFLNKMYPEVTVFGSITLNTLSGGFDPVVIEAAHQLGAKVVWLPTWSADHDLKNGYYSGHLIKQYSVAGPSLIGRKGLPILNEDKTVCSDVMKVLEMTRDFGMVIGTGHLNVEESLKVIEAANQINHKKIMFTHPVDMGASLEDMKKAVSLGAYIEFTGLYTSAHYQGIHPKLYIEFIDTLGSEHVILTTDAFHASTPPQAEFFRMFVGVLLEEGAKPEDIRQMIVDNPYKLLDIE